jgi:hypothetical protein
MDFMKSLRRGERIGETAHVQTRYGKCVLYFTNFSIALESIAKGLVLELEHDSVLSLQPVDKKFLKLVWRENNSTYDLNINCEKPENVASRFRETRDGHINSLRKAGIRTEECATEKVVIKNEVISSRYEKVPKEIPDDSIWNDCWYDKNLNLYITHNKFFKEIEQLQNRLHQINYKTSTGDDGIVAISDMVVTKFGIPAVKMPRNEGERWHLLPTMNKSLLNEDIRNARLHQDPEQRIGYNEAG